MKIFHFKDAILNLTTKFRHNLFKLQNGLCYYCNKEMSLTSRNKYGAPARNFATFEHLVRLIDGGKTNSKNVVLAHRVCNHRANIEIQKKNKNGT